MNPSARYFDAGDARQAVKNLADTTAAVGALPAAVDFGPNKNLDITVEVLRANGLFRAVRLDAGPHDVRFRYSPWPVQAGAALSVVGLAAAIGLGLRLRDGARD
jgi:hypothetical protein